MLTVESLCVYSLQWCPSMLSGSNVLSLEGTGHMHFTTAGPCFLSSSGPLGSPWQPFGTPGTRLAAQASSHRLRKQPRGPPDPHFRALACMPCMFSLFAPARFPTILDYFWHPKADLLGPTTIPWDPSGTHIHPQGPSFRTPSLPLDPLASYWGPFDTPPGSGESLPGPIWDPLGPLGPPLGSQDSI